MPSSQTTGKSGKRFFNSRDSVRAREMGGPENTVSPTQTASSASCRILEAVPDRYVRRNSPHQNARVQHRTDGQQSKRHRVEFDSGLREEPLRLTTSPHGNKMIGADRHPTVRGTANDPQASGTGALRISRDARNRGRAITNEVPERLSVEPRPRLSEWTAAGDSNVTGYLQHSLARAGQSAESQPRFTLQKEYCGLERIKAPHCRQDT